MKFLKNNLKLIIGLIVGAILAGGIVYAATSASQVTYTTNKNGEVQTVADALNDLYNKKQTNQKYDLIWENPTISALEPTTISVDLSNYTSVIIMGCYAVGYESYTGYIKIDVGASGTLSVRYSEGDSTTRNIIVKSNEIEFKEGHMWNNNTNVNSAIPMYIVGIK